MTKMTDLAVLQSDGGDPWKRDWDGNAVGQSVHLWGDSASVFTAKCHHQRFRRRSQAAYRLAGEQVSAVLAGRVS